MHIERQLEIERAARRVHPSPTDAQKQAGNYAKGHLKIHGMDVAIETAKGQERTGVSGDGKPWSVKMPNHYGYIKRTVGADDDQIDVHIGPHHKAPKVFVVDQLDADSGDFDEHKALMGFANRKHAESAYRRSFSDDKADRRMGAITEMSVADFKDWARNGDTKNPVTFKRGGRIGMASGGGLTGWADLPVDADAIAAERIRRSVRPSGGRKEGVTTRSLDALGKAAYDTLAGPSRLVNAHMREYQPGMSVGDMPETTAQLPEVAMNVVGGPGAAGGMDGLGSGAARMRRNMSPNQMIENQAAFKQRALDRRNEGGGGTVRVYKTQQEMEAAQGGAPAKDSFERAVQEAKAGYTNSTANATEDYLRAVYPERYAATVHEEPAASIKELFARQRDPDVFFSNATDAKTSGAIVAANQQPGIRAYHGSPHDFDRFDMSKIGTGEGHQVYGRGLYFAENEGVAHSYRDTLAGKGFKIPDDVNALPDDQRTAILRAANAHGAQPDPLQAAKRAQWASSDLRSVPLDVIADKISRSRPPPGRMYEVNINAAPERFLDWDKPVAMGAPVRGRLKELGDMGLAAHDYGIDRNFAKESILAANNPALTGEGIYRSFGKAVDAARPKLKEAGNPQALFGDLGSMMSSEIHGAGYPGIKYLDQGSRGAGEGSRNYVVFDDKLIDINRKYAAGGAVNPFDEFDAPAQGGGANPFDQFDAPGVDQKAAAISVQPSRSVISKALEPITSYPETYSQMERESRGQITQGIEQLSEPAQRFDPVRDAEPPDSELWRKTKGVGNVAAGALGYLTAPINAGLRTVVGKPIEEATGLPKEYPEFAASLAIPGVGLRSVAAAPTAAATRAREIADASQRLNVPIARAAATDSVPIQSTAGALKEIPVVGAPLVESSKRSLKAMDDAVDRTVAGYGSGEPITAGQAAAEGLESWITGKSGNIANRLYAPVDNLVNPTYTRPLHATQTAVADIMAKRANARIAGTSKAVDEVMDGLQSGGMNYQGLKDLRSYIGEMTPEEMVAKGISKTEAKKIYGALSQDLRGTVLDAGGPDALTAFDRASRLYETIADKRAALAKVIGLKADAAPERVMDRIMAMAGSKGGADYSKLIQVRRAIGPDKWDEVTSAVVNKMGRDKPGAEFSGDRFKTAWDALPDNSKRLLFNSTGKTDLAKSVEDIMTLSGAHRQLMRYGNPSGTGRVATLTGMAGAMWAAPVATLASAVGGNVLARVFASPVAAKNAAKWSLTYSNAAKNPSPGRIAVLGAASENLAKALNRDLGTKLSGSDFMRALQGPAASRAEDEQP